MGKVIYYGKEIELNDELEEGQLELDVITECKRNIENKQKIEPENNIIQNESDKYE